MWRAQRGAPHEVAVDPENRQLLGDGEAEAFVEPDVLRPVGLEIGGLSGAVDAGAELPQELTADPAALARWPAQNPPPAPCGGRATGLGYGWR